MPVKGSLTMRCQSFSAFRFQKTHKIILYFPFHIKGHIKWEQYREKPHRHQTVGLSLCPATINSSPPNATYMCRWNGSALVQVMAYCLFGTKPLPEIMLTYCQLEEQTSVKFESKYKTFHWRKCIWKCLRNSSNFVQGEMSEVSGHWPEWGWPNRGRIS